VCVVPKESPFTTEDAKDTKDNPLWFYASCPWCPLW